MVLPRSQMSTRLSTLLLLYGIFTKDGRVTSVNVAPEVIQNLPGERKSQRDYAFFALRSCHSIFREDRGEFFSPDHLCSNPPLWCNWTIWLDAGKRVVLHLLDLTPAYSCEFKTDEIHLEESPARGRHRVLDTCWQEARHISQANILHVVLLIRGNRRWPYRGFYGQYHVLEEALTAEDAVLPSVPASPRESPVEEQFVSATDGEEPRGIIELVRTVAGSEIFTISRVSDEDRVVQASLGRWAETTTTVSLDGYLQPSLSESYTILSATQTTPVETLSLTDMLDSTSDWAWNSLKNKSFAESLQKSQLTQLKWASSEESLDVDRTFIICITATPLWGPVMREQPTVSGREVHLSAEELDSFSSTKTKLITPTLSVSQQVPFVEHRFVLQETESIPSSNPWYTTPVSLNDASPDSKDQERLNVPEFTPPLEFDHETSLYGQTFDRKSQTEEMSKEFWEEISGHTPTKVYNRATSPQLSKSSSIFEEKRDGSSINHPISEHSQTAATKLDHKFNENTSVSRHHRNVTRISHFPGEYLYEVSVEVQLSRRGSGNQEQLVKTLLSSLQRMIKEEFRPFRPHLKSVSSKRVKSLNAGFLFILWLQFGFGEENISMLLKSFLERLVDRPVAGLGPGSARVISVSAEDVNECRTELVLCDIHADCFNVFGTYACRCQRGFEDFSRIGSGGTLCIDPANAHSNFSPTLLKTIYGMGLLFTVLLLLLLGIVAVLYRRHHKGAFVVQCQRSSPAASQQSLQTPESHSKQREGTCLSEDVPLLKFNPLVVPEKLSFGTRMMREEGERFVVLECAKL
nr:PREDICTED: uncharacterized protein LOC102697643 [Lepisosteus oculatus]